MYDCDLKKQRKELDRKGALLSIYPFDHNNLNFPFLLVKVFVQGLKVVA
jgi:hypothetical protein